MFVKISEILKQQGLFSQDIKARIKNNQISINGEFISDDIEIDCALTKNMKKDVTGKEIGNDIVDVIDAGSFIFDLISNGDWLIKIKFFGIENLFDTNIENNLTFFLKSFIFLKISKKQMFILRKTHEEQKTNNSD